MEFYPNQLFHIYNQGNNRQTLFFTDENYLYFLWKMRAYLLPFGDLVAWCLMPTHFHWQFYVKKVEIERKILREQVDKTEFLRRRIKYGPQAQPVEYFRDRIAPDEDLISLNDAIGTIEKSYTRAINKEKDWSGSLFRKPCQAKDGWINEFVTLRKPDGRLDYRFQPGNDYGYRCFRYINENPVDADLVKEETDWIYSSARDYAGLRRGTLCDLERGRDLMRYL